MKRMIRNMALVIPVAVMLMGAKGCGDDCTKLRVAQDLACGADPRSVECVEAGKLIDQYCRVDPPTEEPTPVPTPKPTPPPVEPPPVEPPPVEPPPATSACPPILPSAEVYLNNKKYGQGIDGTVRVRGDLLFCQAIHGPAAVADCHLDGWPQRTACEMELLAGGCPVAQYKQDWDTTIRACLQVEDDERRMSCDHFGSVEFRDDPITPAFEGQPAQCGEQRDAAGNPMAGFFMVAHGKGYVRFCTPALDGCGPWVSVDH